MKKFKKDVEDVVLTGNHHQQQAEGGVQEISHCSSNQKSEAVSSAHVAARSYDNQYITMEQVKILETGNIRANQHMTGGTNTDEGSRTSVSKNSKLKTAERAENEQGYSSRPQAGKTRARMIINRANIDPFPVEYYIEEFKKQVRL